MNLFLLALAVAVQPQEAAPPRAPLRSEMPPSREPSAANDLFLEDKARAAAGLSARRAMQQFGACVADRSPEPAREALMMDFTTPTYRRRLQLLSQNNASCFRERGRMRSGGLGLAGAVAEQLLEKDPTPLNARLARAALGRSAPAFSPTDRIAVCVVRSVPDQIAALFASEVGSPQEAAAARELEPAVNACNQARVRFTVSTAGARAMLATAALRSVNTAAP